MLYPNSEKYLEEILEIAEKCPEEYKQKCFEILLQGYVTYTINVLTENESVPPINDKPSNETEVKDTQIPPEILQRFKTFSKRLDVELNELETLFDFTVDPFVFQPFNPFGTNSAEKARNITLMLATKSYLTTGNWVADWKEIKSLAVDHNCYDAKHHAGYLQVGKGNIFKSVETGKSVGLSQDGIKQAETMIKKLLEMG